MEFLILGALEVSDGGCKLALGGPKQRAVLAHLILRANHVVATDLLTARYPLRERMWANLMLDLDAARWFGRARGPGRASHRWSGGSARSSADRRWIVMSHPWQSTRDEMYLMSADGDEVFYLGGGSEPRWRPGSG